MARRKRGTDKSKRPTIAVNVGYEAELWQMADAPHGSIGVAEYKNIVLSLVRPDLHFTIPANDSLASYPFLVGVRP